MEEDKDYSTLFLDLKWYHVLYLYVVCFPISLIILLYRFIYWKIQDFKLKRYIKKHSKK